ncbi:hypothetical protein B0H13DRAFT_2347823 [Mycena leptocephala]|nr:hypothetical protein B0H13DRAFT_2347823 [Mycena leptocephala]
MIIGYGGRPRLGPVAPIAVKRSFETLFTELITADIEMLRHTASVHHIDIALGHLLSISHRDSYHSKSFTKLLVIHLTQRNCTAALFCLLEHYTVNLLWPRIAARPNKRAPEFEDAYVMAIWELASLGPRYAQETQTSRPEYEVRFEFWVLDALNDVSTTVLVKLNILSGIYRRHFECPLVVDGLLQHPLIRATGTMKEDKICLSPLEMGNDVEEENLKLFRAACTEAHFTALTAFLQACSLSMMPYKAAETLSYIAFPDFPRREDVPRNAQIHFAKSVQRVVRSQLRDQWNHLLLSPLVAMLNRSIRNVLTDLSASCTGTDAILEAEQESLGSANVNWDQFSDVTNSEGTRSITG